MTQISLWATAHKQEWDHEARAGIKTIQAEVWLKLQSAGVEEETSGETAEVEGRCAGVHCPQLFLQDIIKPLFVFRPPVHSISRRCNPPPNTWPPSLISFFAFLCLYFVNLCSLWNNDSQWHIPMIQGASQRGNHTHKVCFTHMDSICHMVLMIGPHYACASPFQSSCDGNQIHSSMTSGLDAA